MWGIILYDFKCPGLNFVIYFPLRGFYTIKTASVTSKMEVKNILKAKLWKWVMWGIILYDFRCPGLNFGIYFPLRGFYMIKTASVTSKMEVT